MRNDVIEAYPSRLQQMFELKDMPRVRALHLEVIKHSGFSQQ